jgi:hypothetical protein
MPASPLVLERAAAAIASDQVQFDAEAAEALGFFSSHSTYRPVGETRASSDVAITRVGDLSGTNGAHTVHC